MIKKTLSLLMFLVILHYPCNAQFLFKLQAGMSYIEHLSTGITFSFSDKHNITLLYGSNVFINPKDFSSIMLQYDFVVSGINLAGITPGIGIKSGYSVYTNKYYKWNLTEVIPFIRLDYCVSEKIDVFLDMGTALSIEHSVKRRSYGEIGMYRKYLPEFKLGLNYRL
ncbi:MAG: hypothetical protein A2V64_08300 [Bacteroidetes bacterium RBG_13_43_22]|nr:MAG: hypothetical protein A2V64_08300 [Bacteroidetes bacterium RBG_13_43_22]